MNGQKEKLPFNEWTRFVGYEKIRGCYRKSDKKIKWLSEVEKEYLEYLNK